MFRNNYQLICEIHWVPPKREQMDKAIADNIFRAIAKFPNDYSANFTATVESCSPDCINGFHDASIRIPFAEPDQLEQLIKDSNIILLDGRRVIAVCRNVKIKE